MSSLSIYMSHLFMAWFLYRYGVTGLELRQALGFSSEVDVRVSGGSDTQNSEGT